MASKISTLVGILILIHLFAKFIVVVSVSCSGIERNALLKFKGDLHAYLDRLSSWTGDDCCGWSGVFCNQETGSVTKLDLRNPYDLLSIQTGNDVLQFQASMLSGKLNPSLLDLKNLEYLDLSMNNFENTPIPDFIGSLGKLTYLNLSLSSFIGLIPPRLGNLPNLHVLDLHASLLELESVINLPTTMWVSDLNWITRLSSLQYLNLGYVNLSLASATWLQAVNKLHSLQELHLPSCNLHNLPISLPVVNFSSNIRVINFRQNNFNSSIPRWLFNLCNLQALSLSYNQISGELDDFISGLSKCNKISLEFLRLRSNNLSGKIPESLENLKNLKLLTLGENSFSGPIPASFGKLSNLEFLHFSANKLTGTIPESFGELSNLEFLDFSDNKLTGIVPESIGLLNKLIILHLKGNNFEGFMSQSQFLQLQNLKEFSFSCGNKSTVFEIGQDSDPQFSLQLISISNCQIDRNSKFPSWLRTQKELMSLALQDVGISDQIPVWFWEVSSLLQVLDLSNNELQGKLPPSSLLPLISQMDLSFNKFEGPLPLWPSLTVLSLRSNLFSGPIPENIGLLMQGLKFLDLSGNPLTGTIPSSISMLPNLNVLSLSNNQLSGEIPSWENSQQLVAIDLSANNLLGSLPISVCSQTLLSLLNLSSNNLSGKLPSCLGDLRSLSSIDLSTNHLQGEIPEDIGSLEILQALDFSHNQLSGKIPASMSSMNLLNHLNLSYNDLSGPIPTTNKFINTFNDPSIYEGNPKLCGPPLPTSCSKSTKDDHSAEDEDGLDRFWLSILVGFLVGLLTVCSSLAIITSWRHAYFQFVDEIRDRFFHCFNRMPLLLKGKLYWQRL